MVAVIHISFCFPSGLNFFLFRDSSMVTHLQKSLSSIVCTVIKIIYLFIHKYYYKGKYNKNDLNSFCVHFFRVK